MRKKCKKMVMLAITMILCLVTCAQHREVSAKTNVKKVKKTLEKGKSFKISKRIYKINVKNVTFISSKKKVATVSKKGVVKGKKAGTAKITVKKKKTGKKIAVITVKVKKKVTSKPASAVSTAQPTATPDTTSGGQTGKPGESSNTQQPSGTPEPANTPKPVSSKFDVKKIQLPKYAADDITVPEEEYDTLTMIKSPDGNSFLVFYTLNGSYVAGNSYYTETYYQNFYNTYSAILGEDAALEYVNNLKALCTKLACGVYEMADMPFSTDSLEDERAAYEAQGYTCTEADLDTIRSEVVEMAGPAVYDKITLLKAENGSAVVVFSKDGVAVGGDMYFGTAYLDYMMTVYTALLGDEAQAADMVELVKTTAEDLGNDIYSISSVTAGTTLEEAIAPYGEYVNADVATLEDVASELGSLFFK